MPDVPRSSGAGPPGAPSRAVLLRATLAALAAAGVILVTAVLPAEYGIDPLGTGEALGLVVLSEAPPAAEDVPVRPDGLIPEAQGFRVDRRTFELQPGKYVEYKYRMEQGGTMVFSWTADGPVRSEMHSEPWWRGSTAEFFEVVEAAEGGHGSYTAPFPGVHGWYWLNQGDRAVTLSIEAAGFFHATNEYPDGASEPIVREVPAPGPPVSEDRLP